MSFVCFCEGGFRPGGLLKAAQPLEARRGEKEWAVAGKAKLQLDDVMLAKALRLAKTEEEKREVERTAFLKRRAEKEKAAAD
jgi:hypothetical protein